MGKSSGTARAGLRGRRLVGMQTLLKGRYRARLATSEADIASALDLRRRLFRRGGGEDRDAFDALCQHMLIEDVESGGLVGCYRLQLIANGKALGKSYAGQFYRLNALADYPKPLLELGRFCIDPAYVDGDILRIAWAALTRVVDAAGVGMLFGCTSFKGSDPEAFGEAFALLRERHQPPRGLRIGAKAPETYAYVQALEGEPYDPRAAQAQLPALLRSYLQLGGWVSGHAVIDRDLDTLHVFTALEISAIPPARAASLRLIAG